ncbi:MAG: EpsG family protein [Bacteroidota bacterium]
MKKVPGFRYNILLALLLILCSRLPFLNNGYGAEEDSWGLALVAKVIALTNVYEASRFPGHPLQEYIYSTIWDKGPFLFNLFTALISTAGIYFFILTLKKLNARQPVLCGLTLAFVPAIYINSTNDMDYTWALAFTLASFYYLISGKHFISGVVLALAIGCRITSGIMLPVFLIYIWRDDLENKIKSSLQLSLSTLILASLIFLPVFLTYGIGFLTASDYFPYPTLAKVIYKGSMGVFGMPGLIGVSALLIFFLRRKQLLPAHPAGNKKHKQIFEVSIAVILFYTIAFAIKPEKSAYLIPLIPFVILVASLSIETKKLILFSCLLIVSSFTAGLNLDDNIRGNNSSDLSLTRTISEQKITFDILIGPVMADYFKRKNKIEFTTEVVNKSSMIQKKTVIIAGWWMNEILLQLPNEKNSPVEFVFYADETALQKFQLNQYSVVYLPEQNKWNDLRYQKVFTDKYANPW